MNEFYQTGRSSGAITAVFSLKQGRGLRNTVMCPTLMNGSGE